MRERRQTAPFEHRDKASRCKVLPPPAPTPPSPEYRERKKEALPGIPQCWLPRRISANTAASGAPPILAKRIAGGHLLFTGTPPAGRPGIILR
jgi:hypothetical protein